MARARRLFEDSLGPTHPNTIKSGLNHAALMIEFGRVDEAVAALEAGRHHATAAYRALFVEQGAD